MISSFAVAHITLKLSPTVAAIYSNNLSIKFLTK